MFHAPTLRKARQEPSSRRTVPSPGGKRPSGAQCSTLLQHICATLKEPRPPAAAGTSPIRPRGKRNRGRSLLQFGAEVWLMSSVGPGKRAIEPLDLVDQFDRLVLHAGGLLGGDDEIGFVRI